MKQSQEADVRFPPLTFRVCDSFMLNDGREGFEIGLLLGPMPRAILAPCRGHSADTPWHYSEDGVDLVVKDPNGNQLHDSRAKVSDKFEFMVQKRGVHRFCFTNKSPYHETVDFDVHVGHFSYFDQHAKDEHFGPLFEQMRKLDEDLYNIQFEQHWLTAQTDRQAILNENMSKRAIHKALLESAALIAASAVQVYLLRRLFERKLGASRV
ncbi:Transmembrane emp24 domain-containing protein 7 [Hordeum vulgare]|nr:Transmembrane emp24 domain-containing protein 7 [Hordeum vulgare]